MAEEKKKTPNLREKVKELERKLDELTQPPEPEAVPVPVPPAVNTLASTVAGAEFVEMDPSFAASFAVTQVRESKTKDGYLRVQVQAKNKTMDPLRAMYLFNWYDADGVEREDPSHAAWEKITVMPGDDANLSAIAPRKDCKNWKLRFRAISQ